LTIAQVVLTRYQRVTDEQHGAVAITVLYCAVHNYVVLMHDNNTNK